MIPFIKYVYVFLYDSSTVVLKIVMLVSHMMLGYPTAWNLFLLIKHFKANLFCVFQCLGFIGVCQLLVINLTDMHNSCKMADDFSK